MSRSGGLVSGALCLCSGLALAEPAPVDVTDYRDELVVLKVSSDQYLVTSLERMRFRTFWGTEESLNQLRGTQADEEGEAPDHTLIWSRFSDQTLPDHGSIKLTWELGEWLLECGKQQVPVEQVQEPKASQIIADAAFEAPAWQRRPLMLARDEFGTYYYVDEHIYDKTPENLHVYTGWMGKMVRTKLLLVARDSEGSIFATRSGDRRLIMDKEMDRWVEDGVSHPLREVPVDQNWAFIYTTLGVYEGMDYGTPCDRL